MPPTARSPGYSPSGPTMARFAPLNSMHAPCRALNSTTTRGCWLYSTPLRLGVPAPYDRCRCGPQERQIPSIATTFTRRQACWSEYLFTFNMVVRFRPGKLDEKPDSLTRRMDYYLKRGDRENTFANPPNLSPFVTQEKLAIVLRATHLGSVSPALVDESGTVMGATVSFDDIKLAFKRIP